MGALRLSSAAVLMLGWAALRGQRIRLSWRELWLVALAGFLLWVGGNGLVAWALLEVDTGYSALMMATMPLWIVVLDAAIDRRRPDRQTWSAVVLGAGGIGLLSVPQLSAGGSATALGLTALLVAAFSWALGSVVQARHTINLSPTVSAGYQLLFGAVGFALVAGCRAEPIPTPSMEAWSALAYLSLVGSVIGFGSYVYSLGVLPQTQVMTHAYVNPVVAVLLGWLFVGEGITLWTWAGTALVLAGVAVVFRNRSSAH